MVVALAVHALVLLAVSRSTPALPEVPLRTVDVFLYSPEPPPPPPSEPAGETGGGAPASPSVIRKPPEPPPEVERELVAPPEPAPASRRMTCSNNSTKPAASMAKIRERNSPMKANVKPTCLSPNS